MSADNWTVCPKCNASLRQKAIALTQEVEKSYGKVSVEEYHRLIKRAATANNTNSPDTLREDYEIGIYGHEFSVRYGASCTECDFKFEFQHSQQV